MTLLIFCGCLSLLVFSQGAWAGKIEGEDLFFRISSRKGRVAKVLSVDTFQLDDGEVIKLIGIRFPGQRRAREKTQRDQNGFIIEHTSPLVEPDELAFDFVSRLLDGQKVRLEFDQTFRDRRSRVLAYAFLLESELFVNAEILRQGYAHLQTQVLNTKYLEELRSAYQDARRELRGFHSE